jgi:CheY-like chemotaxis protein
LILIVDDNTFNVYSLKLLLEQHFKVTVDAAFSGQEGIDKFKQRIESTYKMYKLVLTDINMPGMDGF